MSSGYIKLYRSIQDNPAWTAEPFSRQQAWIDLLLLANHAPSFVRIAGRKIEMERGQLAWSIVNLANRWQWSSGKVSRFINELKTMHQIEHQNKVVTSVITIVNYDRYQSNDVSDDRPDGRPDGDQIDDQTATRRWTDKKVQEGTRMERIRNTPLPPLNGGNEIELFSDSPILKKMQPSWTPESGWKNIDPATIARWSEAYPACNIERQLKVMNEWLLANPERSHKQKWLRFISNWLKRDQERGGDKMSNQCNKTPPRGIVALSVGIQNDDRPSGWWKNYISTLYAQNGTAKIDELLSIKQFKDLPLSVQQDCNREFTKSQQDDLKY